MRHRMLSVLAVTLLGLVHTLPSVLAQTDGLPDTTIEGRVAEVFGSRFVVETNEGRILVDPVGLLAPLVVSPDDRVSVTGGMAERTLLAKRITSADGSVLHHREEPSLRGGVDDPRDIRAALAALQLTPMGQPVRKKHHTEIMARMSDGRTVFVSFDRFGRVHAIEDAMHDKAAAVSARALSPNDYLDIARRAGFEPLGELETKKHHAELLSRNRTGVLIELHIDRAGYIYKQVWVR